MPRALPAERAVLGARPGVAPHADTVPYTDALCGELRARVVALHVPCRLRCNDYARYPLRARLVITLQARLQGAALSIYRGGCAAKCG